MKRFFPVIPVVLCAILASVYVYPIFSGLILLPLDLLVSDVGPWHAANTILLKNAYMQDSIIQMFPWKHLTFSSLTSGILPLWNPYQFTGMPFMAGMKSLVFYPANVLFLFGELQAWNALAWLQLFLSVWFTYVFVSSLGIKPWFAIFAGIAFGFNSLMMSVLEFGSEGQALLWLPILLYFTKRHIDTKNPWWLMGIAGSVSLSLFAGHLQYTAYGIMLVSAFAIFEIHAVRRERKSVYGILAALAVGIVIAAVQIVPGIEMFRLSVRAMTDGYAWFTHGLLEPYQLLRLLSPDWFGNPLSRDLHLVGYIEPTGYFGIVPLFFALYAVIFAKTNRFVRFFALAAVTALLFSMNGIAQIIYYLRIPVITSGSGGRIFIVFLFSSAILAAFGLKEFLDDKTGRRNVWFLAGFVIVVAFCFATGLILGRFQNALGVSFSNIKMQIAVMGAFTVISSMYIVVHKRFRVSVYIFLVAIIALTYADLFRMGYRFLTFSNPKFLYQEIPIIKFVRSESDKDLSRVYGLTEPEVNTALMIAGTETYNPVYPIRTARFLEALEGASGTRTLENKYYLKPGNQMKRELDFLGVSIIVVGKDVNPAVSLWNNSQYEKDLEKIYSDEHNDVYRNVGANPRFGLFYAVQDGVSDEQAITAISGQSVDFRNTVLIADALDENFIQGSGSSDLISSGLNELTFRVHSDKPAIFYLSDAYYPGWYVSVNGTPSRLLRANYNFRAVRVGEGTSEIRFWYFPDSFKIGMAISGIAIMMIIAIAAKMLIVRPVSKDRGR